MGKLADILVSGGIPPAEAAQAETILNSGSYTWANRPTSPFAKQRVTFSDIGPTGSDWMWDGSYWVPLAPVVLYRGAGTQASPLNTLAAISGTFVNPGSIPAGLFVKPGMRLDIRANIHKIGANGTGTVAVLLGTQSYYSGSFAATDGLDGRIHFSVEAASSATQTSENLAPDNTLTVAAVFQDNTIDFAAAARAVNVTLSGAVATDSYKLVSYSIVLYP
jgi:hypothetical protein